MAVRNDDELDIYVFAYGNNYREAIKALYLICGKVPMIPKYALGNWWSRYYAYTEREYLNVMDRFSRKDIPLTGATVDVDLHWFIDMIRWLDSIPVLARQGGFFVLDGRNHTNSLSNPDILDVMVFNGAGKYVLHEEDDEGILNTEFVSESKQGCQRLSVTVKGTVSDFKRNIRLEFRNVHNGTVTAYENGESVEFAVKEDGYVSVILTNVSVGHSYDIELSYENDVSEYRKNRILYALQRIEGSYEDKRKVWERACLSDEELLFSIDSNFKFTKRQKQRLIEAFPLTAKQ